MIDRFPFQICYIKLLLSSHGATLKSENQQIVLAFSFLLRSSNFCVSNKILIFYVNKIFNTLRETLG